MPIWVELTVRSECHVHLSKLCRTILTLANRAYSAAGQAGSVLHKMVALQVFQAKLLHGLDESIANPDAFNELCLAMALCAIKATANKMGKAMAWLLLSATFG